MSRPGLDVSGVLDDPDFREEFTVVRRHRTVTDGLGAVTEGQMRFSGVIQPADDRTLERLNQGDWKNGGINVWSRERLLVNDSGHLPDEIIWEGDRYICVSDHDWSHYGQGYYGATALLVYGEDGYGEALAGLAGEPEAGGDADE